METLDEVRNFWQKNTNDGAIQPAIIREDVDSAIRSRIKKERKAIAGYFWLSFTYQVAIYSFASYLAIKYYSDAQMIRLCVIGVLLYIPLTFMLMQKFKAMYKLSAGNAVDISTHIKNQHQLLTAFFNFKKRFDLLSIPLTSLILTGILFKLYVQGGIMAHLAGAVVTCLLMLLIYSIAAWFENRKNFIKPLRRLDMILADLEKNG